MCYAGEKHERIDRLANGKLIPTESTWYGPKISASSEVAVPRDQRKMLLAKKKDHSKNKTTSKNKHK